MGLDSYCDFSSSILLLGFMGYGYGMVRCSAWIWIERSGYGFACVFSALDQLPRLLIGYTRLLYFLTRIMPLSLAITPVR